MSFASGIVGQARVLTPSFVTMSGVRHEFWAVTSGWILGTLIREPVSTGIAYLIAFGSAGGDGDGVKDVILGAIVPLVDLRGLASASS